MKTLRTEEARQGRRGMPVLGILVAGLVLLGIAAVILVPRYTATDTMEQPTPQADTAAPS